MVYAASRNLMIASERVRNSVILLTLADSQELL